MNAEQRAAYRAFVRAHHPDRGGDPETFRAGLARFRADPAGLDRTDPDGADPDGTDPGGADGPRFDAPVEVVGPLPLPTRIGVALIRTWRRHRRHRVR